MAIAFSFRSVPDKLRCEPKTGIACPTLNDGVIAAAFKRFVGEIGSASCQNGHARGWFPHDRAAR
ncbi:hypothetical protein [Mesorhizobium argentiipisi]|uniref:Uncharacterized protein n=1 Tax=Mesorhizobium argentiipisi TaxID=3015175 RepID=A0ABU8KB62_9HYPH